MIERFRVFGLYGLYVVSFRQVVSVTGCWKNKEVPSSEFRVPGSDEASLTLGVGASPDSVG
ncbi:MAG: hypothetical protein ACC655_10670, partial [Rhodothermia bacterium]